ncbi:glycosyltransferase family 2 protein [Priestia sp. FSL W8-0524]|uniref:glycosyltransferase family 2 protein n=1 Tax=Priestia sp. FSL W8-0524 TaxID=2954625 RepID=UPI0030F92B3C
MDFVKNNQVSIAMCTYNGEQFIKEQLDSILHQTRIPNELIVCDDGSTDNTLKVLEEFQEIAPFKVEVVSNRHQLGSTKNFEKAMLRCTGDIIFLCDQDDVWDENKIEVIESQFINNPSAYMVFTDANMVDENLNSLGYSLWESIKFSSGKQEEYREKSLDILIKSNVVTGATMAFKQSYLQSIVPISEFWIHDSWIAFLLSIEKDKKVIPLNEKLISYRQHNNNQIGATKKNIISVVKQLKEFKASIVCHDQYLQFKSIQHFLLKDGNRIDENTEAILNEKINHLKVRKELSNNILFRVSKISKEFNSRGYSKFSNGVSSAIKDIFFY